MNGTADMHIGDSRAMARIALISDTHNLLRPEALDWLRGSDAIVHAGDICGAEVLQTLDTLAPTLAVRGNNDIGPWAEALPTRLDCELHGVRLCVVHDIADLVAQPPAIGTQVVVTGHSHRPHVEMRGTVLYVNPGSAGPRRFKLPVSAAELQVREGRVQARVKMLLEV